MISGSLHNLDCNLERMYPYIYFLNIKWWKNPQENKKSTFFLPSSYIPFSYKINHMSNMDSFGIFDHKYVCLWHPFSKLVLWCLWMLDGFYCKGQHGSLQLATTSLWRSYLPMISPQTSCVPFSLSFFQYWQLLPFCFSHLESKISFDGHNDITDNHSIDSIYYLKFYFCV